MKLNNRKGIEMIYEYLMYRLENEEFNVKYIHMWAVLVAITMITLLVCREVILVIPVVATLSYLIEEIFLFTFLKKFKED